MCTKFKRKQDASPYPGPEAHTQWNMKKQPRIQPPAPNVEAETSGVQDGEYHFSKHEYAIGSGKYSGICGATSKNGNIEHVK
ncbi:hypothetical protein AgCh_008005 [Apium graveolens]